MQINQIQFYGDLIESDSYLYNMDDDDYDESISIIGKIKRISQE